MKFHNCYLYLKEKLKVYKKNKRKLKILNILIKALNRLINKLR